MVKCHQNTPTPWTRYVKFLLVVFVACTTLHMSIRCEIVATIVVTLQLQNLKIIATTKKKKSADATLTM